MQEKLKKREKGRDGTGHQSGEEVRGERKREREFAAGKGFSRKQNKETNKSEMSLEE
jgi:hypothetical protein